jgi:hypothetical protein
MILSTLLKNRQSKHQKEDLTSTTEDSSSSSDREYRSLKTNRLILSLLVGFVLSAMIHSFLITFWRVNMFSLDPLRSLAQAISYIIVPMIWFYFVVDRSEQGRSFKHYFGTSKGFSKENLIKSLVEGNIIYLVIAFLLVYFWMFYAYTNWDKPVHIVGAIISVTSVELITKGYTLITLLRTDVNKPTAFSFTMVVWVIGHYIEFLWLSRYISGLQAAFIILLTGIMSTLTVLRYENVFGVWIGHVNLNILIFLLVNL